MIEAARMDEALAQTWRAVGEQLPESERLDGTGLAASVHALENGQIVLVTLPHAEHTTEVHFAAITVLEGQAPRFFVLEHSWTLADEPSTVLCEWTEKGHSNFGTGPSPEPQAFLRAVQVRLS